MFDLTGAGARTGGERGGLLEPPFSPKRLAKRARHVGRWHSRSRQVAWLMALALPLLSISCSRERDVNRALQAEGAERGEVFEVFLDREELRRAADDSSQTFAQVDRDFQQLLKRFEPRKFCKEAELVAFDFVLTPGGRYELSLMFKVHEKLPANYQIHVHAYVADEHLIELSENRRTTGFENWQISPQPPTSEWEIGRYYVVRKTVWAKPIPYRMKVMLVIKKRGQWEQLGKDAVIGWVMGARKESGPLEGETTSTMRVAEPATRVDKSPGQD